MNNTGKFHLRYTQFFIISLISIFLYIASQSLSGGISQFQENLWNRKFLITSFTNLKLTLGNRVFAQVLVGKDGWLEYTSENSLDYYQNTAPVSTETIKNLQEKVQKLYDELNKRNITFVLLIPPNKAAIYPDKLPDEFQKSNLPSNLDAFSEYLKQHGPPILVDLTSALRKQREKQNLDLYYKTDTHWNAYGAFIAYTELMNNLAKSHPELTPKKIDSFRITTSQPAMHDLARLISAIYLLEPGIKLKPKTDDATLTTSSLTLLMYRDSFGEGMQDFISAHFKKATFISNLSRQPGKSLRKAIDTMKPNVIIVEFVERYFNENRLNDFLDGFLTGQN